MSQKRPQTPGLDVEVEIDYENIDVGRIMEAIKNKTGGERSQAAGPAGQRSKIKRLLLKVMTPFAPLIKL
ncbi:MAG: hypothetical protein FJY81_02905, partial [Candidatus Aminicenantes bacterium]|nr:hypothetical protein [Candidatus Aminicenantes bacterium]